MRDGADRELRRDPRDVLLMKALQQIVNREWNPLSLPHPEDEYASYMPGIQRMLACGKGQLAWYLLQLEKFSMGLPGDRQRCDHAAGKLVAYMVW